MQWRRRIVAVLVGLVATTTALAQLQDPTRPPLEAMTALPETGLTAGAEDVIQAVFVRPDGKSAFIVNGKTLHVGESWGGRKVVRISENEIVVRSEAGRESIAVYPGIVKSQALAKTAAQAAGKIRSKPSIKEPPQSLPRPDQDKGELAK